MLKSPLFLSWRLLAVFGLLLAGPAGAGVVLIPVPEPNLPDGTTRLLRVVLSNTGEVTRRATPTFIPAGADGTGPARVTGGSIAVAPKATVVVEGLATDDGLVELVTAPQLVIQALLVLRDAAGNELSTMVLPITDDTAVDSADASSVLLELARGGGLVTDLMLVNVDAEGSAECTVDFFGANGTMVRSIAGTVAPYSMVAAGDVLAGVTASLVKGVVSCDRAFDTWAIVTDLGGQSHRAISPPALGTSTLAPPGTSDCPIGGVCLTIPGVVHTASGAAPNRTIQMPVPAGRSFARMKLELDITAGQWYGPDSEGHHGLFWLHRGSLGAYDRNVFGSVNSRGTRNRLLMVTNIDMAPGDHTFDTAQVGLTPGQVYHVVYELDSATRRATLTMTKDGATIVSLPTNLGGPLGSGSASSLVLSLGHALNQGGVEVPWLGTTWSNLTFEATP